MTEDSSLRDFVLGYCRQLGAVVEPPAYGVYETLLPDETAARWGISPYQFFAFASDTHLPNGEETTFLHYGHPLVETIVAELRAQAADTQWFINPTRLEKPGLAALAEKTYQFPNARLTPLKTGERRRMHHYVCFNFKSSLIADEKREMIVPLWMSLQGGYRVHGAQIQASAPLETTNEFSTLEPAAPSWHIKPRENVLSPDALSALLDRARTATLDEMAATLDAFQHRLARFLELDRARLTDYYTGLQRDLERRLAKADDERRPGLESKLAALHTERQAKLADAEEKYRLRVELELINLAVIAQPKLELDVEVSKRTATAKRTILWDPLLHVLEPLVCDVCGQPGGNLWLCERGHLAHADCLTPQCLDCKRTFCRLCAEQMHVCVVCDGAVCIHSLVKCKKCGRETCQKHATLCHAADGQPQRLEAGVALPALQVSSPSVGPTLADQPIPQPKAGKPGKPAKQVKSPAKGTKGSSISPVRSMQVEIDITKPVVTAFVNHKEKQIAARWWELAEDGIRVGCQCEKGWSCPDHGKMLRPRGPEEIQGQVIQQIRRFAQEYQVAQVKTKYFNLVANTIIPLHRFGLGEQWKDPAIIALAQAGYDKLPPWQQRQDHQRDVGPP